jgi:hypothetical protein
MRNYSQLIEIARYQIEILNKTGKEYRPKSILFHKNNVIRGFGNAFRYTCQAKKRIYYEY